MVLHVSTCCCLSCRRTRAEMDEPTTPLIAAYGYCSQDLVNLLLVGCAATNCFNGTKQVAGSTCRGVPAQGDLGFLTLFEHYGHLEVGR